MSRDAERDRYQLHQNSCEDAGYLIFLEQLIAPVVARLQVGSEILDYGSGPTPVMARLLEARGFAVTIYDPYFSPDQEAFLRTYDAVVCCETAEHFREPLIDWSRMLGCLRENGILAVMTLQHNERTDLQSWWYAQDPTHICFYSRVTFEWIAARFRCELDPISERVAVLTKK